MKKILLLSVCLFVCWALFAQQRIKVACVGNSITYGTGLADRATQSYPVQLQKLLGEHYEVEPQKTAKKANVPAKCRSGCMLKPPKRRKRLR